MPLNQIDRVRFRLSHRVLLLLGLDDHVLIAQSFPTFKRVARTSPSVDLYQANLGDAKVILDDLHERSLNDPNGFGHDANERRALRNAAAHVRGQIALFTGRAV